MKEDARCAADEIFVQSKGLPFSSVKGAFPKGLDCCLSEQAATRLQARPGGGASASERRPTTAARPSPPCPACPSRAVTLAFTDSRLESRFRTWYSERAAAHDKQAALVYLWMVALGSLLYLAIAAFAPALRPANVDQCTPLIVCSWLGPAAHLGLLRLLPRSTYVAHRPAIILALRVFYVASTSLHGFAQCGMAPLQGGAAAAGGGGGPGAAAAGGGGAASSPAAGAGCPLESPLSALLWRSGIVGMVWWGAAFPLLFWQHVALQAASCALYAASLAPAVCASLASVRWGAAVVAAVEAAAHSGAAQLAAAVGAPRLAAGYARRAAAAAAAAASSSRAAAAAAAAGGVGGGGCVQSLAFLQLVLGVVLPAFIKYCWEARKRQGWWRDAHHHQQQQYLTQRTAAAAIAAGPAMQAAGAGQSAAASSGAAATSAAGAGAAAGLLRRRLPTSQAGAAAAGGGVAASQQQPQQPQRQQQQRGRPSLEALPEPAAAAAAAAGCGEEDWEGEFDAECAAAGQPPSSREVFVLAVVVGLSWTLMGHWLGA